MSGALFLAPIFNILGFWDVLGDPLGILYDENLQTSFYTIIATQITAMLYIFEADFAKI